jgi:hypothetical protein
MTSVFMNHESEDVSRMSKGSKKLMGRITPIAHQKHQQAAGKKLGTTTVKTWGKAPQQRAGV